jgi:hypothetical protein
MPLELQLNSTCAGEMKKSKIYSGAMQQYIVKLV